MNTMRSRAAGWLGRFGVPVILSLLLHVVVAAQRIELDQPETGADTRLAVALREAEAAPAAPRGTVPTERPPPARRPVRPPRVPPPQRDRSASSTRPRPAVRPIPAPHDQPPRPTTLPSARELAGASQGSAAGSPPASASQRIFSSAPPGAPPPPVAPTDPPEAPGAGAPSGGGAGFSFDFWSPPDFNREMERARRAIGAAEREHQRAKTTDPGHGVICNTEGYWFLCPVDDIAACNDAHDGMCRYAKPAERRLLADEVILFQ
jgi:hypothetical protein